MIRLVFLGFVAATGLSAPARAALVQAEWTGLAYGQSNSDMFGLGRIIDGAAYRLTFTYDTNRGVRTTYPRDLDHLDGGSDYGVSSPVLSVVMVINGIAQTVMSGVQDNIQTDTYSGASILNTTLGRTLIAPDGSYSFGYATQLISSSWLQGTASVSRPYSAAWLQNDSRFFAGGIFEIGSCNALLGSCDSYTTAQLFPDSVTMTVIAPVPVPAAGFGLLAALGGLAALGRRISRTPA